MRLAVLVLLALTALRLWLAATLPLAPDEDYYLLWAQHLQAGYFDHPPMVAWWIKAGTMLCGNSALGVRLLGPLAGAIGSVLLWDAAEQLAPGRGLIAAALLNATLLIGAGVIIMTPDTPLLLFWTLGLAALARLIASGNPRWWLAVGLAAGGMLLSKYTALLFIIAVFLWLVTSAAGRRRLATPWPWAGMLLALLIFSPNITWNAAHGWASYLKQGGREAAFNPASAGQFLFELVVGQAGLCTPIILVLAGLGLWRLRRDVSLAARLLFWLTVVPGVVMLAHVLSDRVQSNWVAIMYPAACLAAAMLPAPLLARWFKPALALGFGITALAYVQAVTYIVPLPAGMDTEGKQFAGWQDFADTVMAGHPAFVTADDYATLSVLAVDGPRDVMVAGFPFKKNWRWSYFGYPAAVPPGTVGILVTREKLAHCPVLLGRVTRHRGTEDFPTYHLCLMTAPVEGFALPRP
jgi:4-amino-4-deoxy-L-arabinose transferase-like glycosyltransferase